MRCFEPAVVEKRYVQVYVSVSMRERYEQDGWGCVKELPVTGACVMQHDIRVNIGV